MENGLPHLDQPKLQMYVARTIISTIVELYEKQLCTFWHK
jgi:hypothetical protein